MSTLGKLATLSVCAAALIQGLVTHQVPYWFLTLALIALYLLPAYVARCRNVKAFGQVVVVNLLFGWTLIGWGIALAMAFRERQPGWPRDNEALAARWQRRQRGGEGEQA